MSNERATDQAGERTSGARTRIIVAVIALAVLGIAAVAVIGTLREDLVELVDGFGAAAPVVYVVAHVVLSLVLVPSSLLALAAGILFGPLWGGALAMTGGGLSALAGFVIGRRIGRVPFTRVAGRRMDKIDRWLQENGVAALAVARNLPGLPFGAMNYAAGAATGMRLSRFTMGTLLGLLPGSVAYAGFGGTLDDVTSTGFVVATALLLVVVVGGMVLDRRLSSPDR